MFTTNRFLAAPVVVSREHLELAQPQAVVINSGVANAATGVRGELDARATAAEAARLLDLDSEEVVVLSTGVIGAPMPMANLLPGLKIAAAELSPKSGPAAAEAILTTDTRTKQAASPPMSSRSPSGVRSVGRPRRTTSHSSFASWRCYGQSFLPKATSYTFPAPP